MYEGLQLCLSSSSLDFLTVFQRMWPLIKLFPLNIIKVWRNLKIHRRIWKIMWTANAVDTFIYKKLSRENKLLKDKQSWSPPSMVSYFYPTISISIGLVPRMLIRLYCSTLWTGPYKGVKQETQIILIKITYWILEKDFQFLCFTFLLFFKKGRSSEKGSVFMFVTRMVQKGFFQNWRRAQILP